MLTVKVVRCVVQKPHALVLTCRVVDGERAGETVLHRLDPGMREDGRIRFFRTLAKFGLGRDFFQGNPSMNDVADTLVSRVAAIDVG